MRNQKGITLIALVITIIVLLILAGVSIAMLTGQNGILKRATEAKGDTARAEVVERINMELNAVYTDALAGQKKFDATYIAQINTNLNGKAKVDETETVTGDTTTSKITITGVEDGYTGITGYVDASGATVQIDPAE